MAPVKPLGNDGFVTEIDIRIWLRDEPAANLLLDDYEYTPEEIRTAMTHSVDFWNDQPPYIGCYDVKTFPWRSGLMRGTVATLLFMAANRFRRNTLQYSAAGTTIDDQNKAPAYDMAAGRMWDEYKNWVATHKRAVNAERGWAIIL